MTQNIVTLIQEIKNKTSDLDGQINEVINEAKNLRKKVADWVGGGDFGEKTSKSLEEDILNYNNLHDDFKEYTSRKCRSILHAILGKNKDIINDLYEAFAITFTDYLNASTNKKLGDLFYIGKDIVKKPLSSLYKGIIFYDTLAEILKINQRFTRDNLSPNQRKKINEQFRLLKTKTNDNLNNFDLIKEYNFQLDMYVALVTNRDASYKNYIAAIKNIDQIKTDTRDIQSHLTEPHEKWVKELNFKTYVRCWVYSLTLYQDLIYKIENDQINVPLTKNITKKKVLQKLKKTFYKMYQGYGILTEFTEKKIKESLDPLPEKIHSYFKKQKVINH